MGWLGNFYGSMGRYYHARDNMDQAEHYYAKADRAGTNNANNIGTYGVLLLRTGRFEQALAQFDKALSIKGVEQRLRNMIRINRALAYFRLGNTEKALVALEDIHANMPCQRSYQSLGFIYTAAGMFDKAEPFNLAAVEYDPEDYVVLDNTAQMYIAMGRWDKARDYLARALEQRSGQSDILYHKGLIHEHDGEPDEAIACYEEALTKKMDALNDVTPEKLRARIAAIRSGAPQ